MATDEAVVQLLHDIPQVAFECRNPIHVHNTYVVCAFNLLEIENAVKGYFQQFKFVFEHEEFVRHWITP